MGSELTPSLTNELDISLKTQPEELKELTDFTPEEERQISEFAQKIDIKDSQIVLAYGSSAQKKMADFSDTALEKVKTKDLGETGELLANAVVELKNIGEEDKKGVFGFVKKQKNRIEAMKAKYSAAENNIDSICDTLKSHQLQLTQDAKVLDKMYNANLSYYKELTMYIAAGKLKLEETEKTELAQLNEKAKQTGRQEDISAASDLKSMCERFDKKIHDLELTRMVSIQMAPQIRLIQDNDILMAEKINSMIVNTVPLWKSQMVIALGIEHSKQAAEAQRQVSDMTNALLKQNAENLKIASTETAKELERGIIDVETIKSTNDMLISTIDEVSKIHEEGKAKRKEAEKELALMEEEFKAKLLEAK